MTETLECSQSSNMTSIRLNVLNFDIVELQRHLNAGRSERRIYWGADLYFTNNTEMMLNF